MSHVQMDRGRLPVAADISRTLSDHLLVVTQSAAAHLPDDDPLVVMLLRLTDHVRAEEHINSNAPELCAIRTVLGLPF